MSDERATCRRKKCFENEQLEQDLVLHVTAVPDGAEEAFHIGGGKQLRQLVKLRGRFPNVDFGHGFCSIRKIRVVTNLRTIPEIAVPHSKKDDPLHAGQVTSD
jgi:hypothetical protein